MIKFSVIQSTKPLNKSFDKNGIKTNRGKMTIGSYQRTNVNSLKEFFIGLEKLTPNQAITLGITKEEKGQITTAQNQRNYSISRTKKYFSFHEIALLLLDYDPSIRGYQIDSPEEFVRVMRDIDPSLRYCDVAVRYGSSCGIHKNGVLLNAKKSMHAYIIVNNATNEKVIEYKNYLVSKAWAKGYGHIEISKSGSIMRRQVFDAAVFSPERLVFEAEPTLEEGITRVVPDYKIFEGEKKVRDLNKIPDLVKAGEEKFIEAKRLIKGESENKKNIYIRKEVLKQENRGFSLEIAETIVRSRVENKELLPDDVIINNDGEEIKISTIINNPEQFDSMYIKDPIEPEKGPSKAIINVNKHGLSIWSYLHGGVKYTLIQQRKNKESTKKGLAMQEKTIEIKPFSNLIVQKLNTVGEFELDDVVSQIINTGIPITSYYTDLYIYIEGYWQKHENEDIEKKIFIKACITKIIGKRPNKKQIDAVHRELLMEYIDMPITQEILINFNDGILKIKNGNYEKILHNPEYRKLYKLDFPYEPSALSPLTDKFCLDVMGDQDTVDLFFEFIGSCFINNDYFKLEKSLFLYGSGSNGKSVLLDLIRHLFGLMNISTVALKDMCTPERRHSMVGKLLNIASEGSSKKFDSEDFKAIVTREPLPVRVMYDNATDTNDFPRLIFATNNMPYTGGDTSHGILRRIIIIDFEKVIEEENQDKQLLEKLKTELPGVMNRVLEGMMRLLKNGNLTKSQKVDKTLEKYEMQINPVKYFIAELSIVTQSEAKIYSSKKLYTKFQKFCLEVGIHAVNMRNFNSMMKNVFGEIQHSNTLYGWRVIEKKTLVFKQDSPPYD